MNNRVLKQMKEEVGKPLMEVPMPERLPEVEDWIRANLDGKVDEATLEALNKKEGVINVRPIYA